MESRKRPHEDDNESSMKRRILSDGVGSPRPNGANLDSEPSDADKLEMFRKEAIYRRMKHYARESERSQAHVAELERRKRSCEAGLAVMSACWSQLVDTIRSLVSPEEVPDIHIDTNRLFDITAKSSSDQEQAVYSQLESSLVATKTLVTKLAQLSGNHTSRVLSDEESSNYRQECKVLEAELSMCRTQVEDLRARNDRLRDDLHAAENRVERAHSSTVMATQKRRVGGQDESPKDDSVEPVVNPSSPSHTPSPMNNGIPPEGSFPALDDFRDKKLKEYEQEIARLQHTNVDLQARLARLPSEKDPDAFVDLVDEYAKKVEYLARPSQGGPTIESRLEQALADVLEKAKEITTQPLKPEFKSLLSKRDADAARLREHRDQVSAELLDRKHKDSSKYPSMQAYKNALESRGARLSVVEAQLRRCKARLASEAGLTDILEFLTGSEADIVPELRKRLQAAESRVEELEKLNQRFGTPQLDIAQYIDSVAALKDELRDTSSRLDQYRRIYGELATPSPNPDQLADRLRQKDQEVENLRKQVSEFEQVEAQLSSEVERLSNAWDQHDAIIRSKMLEVAPFEERLTKLTAERSKLENKFYAAMRERDAAEAARKSLERAQEKLSSTLDKYNEMLQISETAMSHLQRKNDALTAAIKKSDSNTRALDSDILKLQAQLELERVKINEAQRKADLWEQVAAPKTLECRKQEETILRMKKDFEKQMEKAKEASVTTQTQSSGSYLAQLKEILQCRICKTRIRDTVITKCMHTFCRECLDTRIATRQRKCPSCQLAFGQADVHAVYFQG